MSETEKYVAVISAPNRARRQFGLLAAVFGALLVAVGIAVGWMRSAERSETPPATGQISPDEQYRRMVLGTWHDEYQGKRTMTLDEDGTGTMIVELSGLKATLFASRLRFDMRWSVAEGHLKKQTIGGEPQTQVQLILKTMGDQVDEPILDLSETRLLLLDQDGKAKYDWRRAEEEGERD